MRCGSEGNGPRKSCSNQSPCDPSEVVNHLSSVGGGSTSTGSGFPGETESPEVETPEHHRGCSDVEEASVCQLPTVPLDHGLTLSSRYTSRSFPYSRSSLSPALRSFGCFCRPTPPDLVPVFARPYGYSVSDCNRVGVQTDTPTSTPVSVCFPPNTVSP